MSFRKVEYAGVVACFLCLFIASIASMAFGQAAPARGGRYDRQILSDALKITSSRPEYKTVRVAVEDNIVTLSGTVHLESSRLWLERQVRHVAHVKDVRNELTLDPPVPPDSVLAAHIQRRLEDAGFVQIRSDVVNGRVVVSGVVRNHQQQRRALQVVRTTPGVREVVSKLTAAE